MKGIIVFITLIIGSFDVLAAGSGGHGSPKDLIFPAINFIALVGLFVWKLGPKLSAHFSEKHVDIKETAQKAEMMKVAAEKKLEEQVAKNNNLSAEVSRINEEATKEINGYKTEKELENKDKISKLKKDAENKVQNQKSEFVSDLTKELLDNVVMMAKKNVKNDAALQGNLESNLLKELK